MFIQASQPFHAFVQRCSSFYIKKGFLAFEETWVRGKVFSHFHRFYIINAYYSKASLQKSLFKINKVYVYGSISKCSLFNREKGRDRGRFCISILSKKKLYDFWQFFSFFFLPNVCSKLHQGNISSYSRRSAAQTHPKE